MGDTIGFAVLDSACTKTVAGQRWIEEYKGTLTEEQRKQMEVSRQDSNSVFRYGAGVEKKAMFQVKLPGVVVDQHITIGGCGRM